MTLNGSSALSGLLSAQRALEVVGHNVANAATPGYSRQRVDLQTRRPQSVVGAGQIGTGVKVAAVRRTVDQFLQGRLQGAEGRLGVAETFASGVGEFEEMWQQGGETLGASMTNLANAAEELAARPDDAVLRSQFLDQAQDLARRVRDLAGETSELRQDLGQSIQVDLDEANSLVEEVKSLNLEIRGLEVGGQSPNDLLDRRTIAVRALGRLIGAEASQSSTGGMTLRVGGRVLLSGQNPELLSASIDSQGLSSVKVGDAIVQLDGGQVLGIQRAQASGLASEGELDTLARGVIQLVNRANAAGVPATGPHTFLESAWPTQDVNGNGILTDDPLATSGLSYPASATTLQLSVTDPTGTRTTTALAFDPASGSLTDLATALDAVPFINAIASPEGTLRVSAAAGYGFDFADPSGGDPDPGGLLASLGIGAVFEGNDAASMEVAIGDPDDLALGWTASPGDGRNATRIASALSSRSSLLGDTSPSGFLGGIVTQQGLVARRANDSQGSSGATLDALEARNESVSGVSLEEEVADLLKFQQAFKASARYLQVINEVSDSLLGILR